MNTNFEMINTKPIESIDDLIQTQDKTMTIGELEFMSKNDLYMICKYNIKAYMPPKRCCNKNWLAKIAAPNAVYFKRSVVHN